MHTCILICMAHYFIKHYSTIPYILLEYNVSTFLYTLIKLHQMFISRQAGYHNFDFFQHIFTLQYGLMTRSRKRFAHEIPLFVYPFKAHLGTLQIDSSVSISVYYACRLRVRKPLVVDKALRSLDVGSVETVYGNVWRSKPRVNDTDSCVHFKPLGVSHILE